MTPDVSLESLRSALAILYQDLAEDVAQAGPICVLSGRCCRFAEYGHTLFLSKPEAMILLADAPEPLRPMDDEAHCPWQDREGRCTAREARPLGCRVYYCEDSYQEESHELSEKYISRLRQIAEEMGLPWDYAPLHRHLKSRETGLRNHAEGPREDRP